eukprot:2974336-Rhodomonas_salina.1
MADYHRAQQDLPPGGYQVRAGAGGRAGCGVRRRAGGWGIRIEGGDGAKGEWEEGMREREVSAFKPPGTSVVKPQHQNQASAGSN